MKKLLVLACAMVLLAGCGSSSDDAGGTKETKTCSMEQSGMKIEMVVSGESDEVEMVNAKITMSSSLFNGLDFSTVTDDQKKQLEETVLTQYDLKEGDGVTVKTDFQKDSYSVDVGVDFTKVSDATKQKLGFEDAKDMKISDYVKNAEAGGATCK